MVSKFMPMPRLEIAKSDIARVAQAAQVCRAVVVRYRAGANIRRAQEAAITMAVADVDREAKQLGLPVVEFPGRAVAGLSPAGSLGRGSHSSATRAGGQEPLSSVGAVAGRINPRADSPNMGQPGESRSCPPGLGDYMSPTPGTPAGRSAPIASIPDPPRYVSDANIPEAPACVLTLGQIASIPAPKPPDEPAFEIYEDRVHRDVGRGRAVKVVKVPSQRCHVTILDEFGEVVQP